MKEDFRSRFAKRRESFLAGEFKTPFKQILSYLWDYKRIFIVMTILGLIQSALFLSMPLFLAPILDILVNPAGFLEKVLPLFIAMITIQIITAVLFGIRIYVNRWIGANVIFNIRNDIFLTLQKMSFGWFDKRNTGELISRTTSDVNLLKDFLSNSLQLFIRQIATFILSFVVLFIINFELAVYICIISPALFYTLYLFRKKIRPVFRRSRETYANLTDVIQENIQGVQVVKSFAREGYEVKKFSKTNDQYYDDSLKIIKLQTTFDPIVYLIDNIAFLITLLVGGLLVFGNRMSFGDLFAFVLVLNFSVEPLYFLARFLANMPQITETSERLVNILNSEVLVKEKEDAIEIPSIDGKIVFENVYFRYDTTDKEQGENDYYVLKDINLEINPGETIAILGATGSGKSTLIKLIPRFYDVSKGRITINGIDIRDVTFKSLRKQIGYVSQDRILFSRTLKDNIAFGERKIGQLDVEEAARIANIDDFIKSQLPDNYNTKVGERGVTLSGGQKQRVTIARALAVKPRILLLDDCFSSIDVDTEFKIQRLLRNVIKNSTTFMITQRMSTVRHADKIIVLDNGCISQFGSHHELINQTEGIYRKLYKTLKVEERA
ncbi:MAG: ABC transporter ATP-binding protein [Candidatus Lokiarchaeota archaeon]